MKASDDLSINLKVNSASFERGMTEAARSAENYKRKAKDVPTVTKKVSNQLAAAANNAAILFGPLDGLSGRLSALSGGLVRFSPLALGVAAGFTAIVGGVFAASRAFIQYEEQQARTNGLLLATGHIAGFTRMELELMAQAQARATLASVEDTRKAQQVLLTFRSVQNETFTKALSLAQDMSEVFGGVSQAATQLGKALEDPNEGLSSLSRTGVTFSEVQKQRIRQLTTEGQLQKAQAIILGEVEKQLGGVAEAVSNGTISGGMDSISQSLGNILVDIAQFTKLDSLLSSSTGAISEYFMAIEQATMLDIARFWPDDFDNYKTMQASLKGIREQIKSLNDQEVTSLDDLVERNDKITELEEEAAEIEKYLYKNLAAVEDELAAENAAKREAEKEQKKLRSEKAKEQQKASQEALDQLKISLGGEKLAIEKAHTDSVEKTKKLTLSQEQVEKEGYETLAELKDAYIAKSREKADEELAELKRRHDEKVKRAAEQAKREEEAKARARQQAQQFTAKFDDKKTDTDRAEQRALDKLKEIHQGGFLPAHTSYEQQRLAIVEHYRKLREAQTEKELDQQVSKQNEAIRRARQQIAAGGGDEEMRNFQRMEKIRQLAKDHQSGMLEDEKLYAQAVLAVNEEYAAKEKAVEDKKKEDRKRQQNEELRQKFSTNQQLGRSVEQLKEWETMTTAQKFSGMAGLGEQFLGSMAGQSKKAFKIQKAFQIAQAVMNTYQMATGAYNSLSPIPIVGPVLGAAAAAAAVAFGIAQVNKIRRARPQGQFHQGIDYVPDTGDYTLLKGERVLDDRLNADLKGYLSSQPRSPAGGGDTYNLTVNAHDASGFDRLLDERQERIYGMMRSAKAEQGEVF